LDVDISVNRLSGSLGSTVENCDWNVVSDNILRGNMFSFSMVDMDPQTQSDALAYYGSYILNISMMVASPQLFMVACLVTVHMIKVYIYGKSLSPVRSSHSLEGRSVSEPSALSWMNTFRAWYAHWRSIRLPVDWVVCLDQCLQAACLMISVLTLLVFLFMSVFPLLKSVFHYGTYTHQYSWLVSAAYMHGLVPVLFVTSTLIIGVVTLGVLVMKTYRPQQLQQNLPPLRGTVTSGRLSVLNSALGAESATTVNNNNDSEKATLLPAWYELTFFFGKMMVIFVINLFFVGAANTAYLVEVLDNNPQIQIIQFALSIFKLVWNALCIPASLKWLVRKKDQHSSAASAQTSSAAVGSGCFLHFNPLMFRYLIKLFNFVLVPCIVTSMVSNSCFLKLFQQQPAPVIYSEVCDGVYVVENQTLVCPGDTQSLQDTALTPPFIYSFQCSSSLITNYIPVLLYSFAISGFVVPGSYLVYMVLSMSSLTPTLESNSSNGNCCKFSRFADIVDPMLPRVVRRSTLIALISQSGNKEGQRHQQATSPIFVAGTNGRCDNDATDDLCYSSSRGREHCDAMKTSFSNLIPCESLVASQLFCLTLFATFGCAFPYLGVVIIVSAGFEMLTWMLAVGRYQCVCFVHGRPSAVVPAVKGAGKLRPEVPTAIVPSASITTTSSSPAGPRLSSLALYQLNKLGSDLQLGVGEEDPYDQYRRRISRNSASLQESFLCSVQPPAEPPYSTEPGRASSEILAALHSFQPLSWIDFSIIIYIVCFFWSALCFDMIGDVYGTKRGLITLFVVVFVAPPVAIVAVKVGIICRCSPRVITPATEVEVDESIRRSGQGNADSNLRVDERFSINAKDERQSSNSHTFLRTVSSNSDF
jgi:hypothetical protein